MVHNRRRWFGARLHPAALAGAAMVCAVGLVGAVAAEAAPATGRVVQAATATDPSTKKKQVDAQIKGLSVDLEETNKDLLRAYQALKATQAKIPAARAALTAAQAAEAAAELVDAKAEQDLAVAKANQGKAQDELDATRASIEAGQREVAQVASQMYQEQGLGQISVAMDSTSPQDFADRLAMVNTVIDLQNQSLGRLANARADQQAQQARLAALRLASADAQARAAAALAAAATARDRAAAASAALVDLAAQQKSQTAAVATKAVAEKRRLRAMRAESDRLATALAARARAARRAGRTSGAGGRGFLSPPVTGIAVSSEFGLRFHPILHAWILHEGRDYAAPCGTPVHAAANGWVVSAGWGGGYGNRLVVDHGYQGGVDLSTTYNHLTRFVVTHGWVHRGEVIAYSGTTGLSTGCHIHFETRQNGAPVDPRRWL